MYEGDIEPDALAAWVNQLEMHAEVLEFRCRPEAGHCDGIHGLADALVERKILSAQVVYRYEDEVWCDTLLNSKSQVRLVRWGPVDE